MDTRYQLALLAHVITLQRDSVFYHPDSERDDLNPPGKNWPQAFYKRHPELKTKRLKALDWERHDHHIYDKLVHWFTMIGRELAGLRFKNCNIYNMDETGVLLSVLNGLKCLVSALEARNYRGAAVKRTLITAIECISADGFSLLPMIVWPASTHRATWTTHPTPDWHFALQESGYTDTKISFEWLTRVFHPQTVTRANGEA